MVSTFLKPTSFTKEGDLASLHLRRDQSLPVILSTQVTNANDEGYAEGVVTNTRFGSFPHSTIIGAPWGSQVRASKVDTGSRGRAKPNKKRKAEEALVEGAGVTTSQDGTVKQAEVAESGFIHVLPPTPENWTTSLPHRTQVVYTPDYSYILHRIRVRPGSRLIEAGSGSGSFTHAAARAVFSENTPCQSHEDRAAEGVDGIKDEEAKTDESGRVFTFEFHSERQEKVKAEMIQHGLDPIVHAMHRNVYKAGFLIYDFEDAPPDQRSSPCASAVFLDLPAPWKHFLI